jgi:hypothetical protein
MSATGAPPATSGTLDTGDPPLVNTVEAWAWGVVDVSTGQVHVTAYAV